MQPEFTRPEDRRPLDLAVRADAIGLLGRFVRGEISSSELLRSVRHLSTGRDGSRDINRDISRDASASRGTPLRPDDTRDSSARARNAAQESWARLGEVEGLEELVENLELKTSDYSRMQLDRQALCKQLDAYLQCDLSHRQLSDWVLELHHVYCHPQYRASDFYSQDLEFSLMLLALFLDLDVSERPRHSQEMVARLLRALRRQHPVPLEFLLERFFAGKDELHLVTREFHPHPEESWREAQWTELVLVPQSSKPQSNHGGWFVPLVVCTESLWREGAPHGSWAHPENDRILRLRESVPSGLPNLLPSYIPRYGCRYFFDPEGLVEVVLDRDELHVADVEVAVQLFCYANNVQNSCTLNGTHVFPAEEEL